MDPVDLASIASELAVVAADQTPAAALDALALAGRGLVAVISLDEHGSRRPLSMIARQQLFSLRDRRETLGELSGSLPPLVTVDASDVLDADSILAMADTLASIPAAPGVLVGDADPVPRGISREKIAAVLPLDLLAEGGLRFAGATPVVPIRRYICRKCVPPSYRLPREAGEAPACQRIWFHGPMEPDGDDS